MAILLCSAWSAGVVPHVLGQAPGHGRDVGADTVPVVTTNFTEPTRPENPAFSQTLGGCLSIFDRTLALQSYDHPTDHTPARDTLLAEELRWQPLLPEAIAAARQCYHRTYRSSRDVADADLAALWPLAIAMNEDTVAQAIIARRLALMGPDLSAQATLLVKVVRGLMGDESDRGEMHLTDAHVAMARQYLAQLEAMGPPHILAWMDAEGVFRAANAQRPYSDASIQQAIDDAQHALAVMQGVPPTALGHADQQKLQERKVAARVYGVARFTYFKTLSHADLTRFIQLVDSNWPGGKRSWLVGTPAPPVTADYWFGTPGNVPPANLPAPHTVSLIVFMRPAPGRPATRSLETDVLLRRIHTLCPTLPIILMSVTEGSWANTSLLKHPEREAELMYHYVHDSLQVPGIMGVVKGQQHVVTSDGVVMSAQLPLFNRYMLDVGGLSGQMFVVDQEGWVVDMGAAMALVPRLVAKAAHPTH